MVGRDRWYLDEQEGGAVSRREPLEFRAACPVAADVILDTLPRSAALPNPTVVLSVDQALPEVATGIRVPACAAHEENLPARGLGAQPLGS